MQPGRFDLPLRRNAVAAMRMQLFAIESANGDVPLDLTGCSFKLDIRLYPGQPGAPLLSVSTDSHIAIVDAAAGEIEIDWPAVLDRIAAMPSFAEAGDPTRPRVDTFAYDLLLTASDGVAQAILEGSVPVSYGVTANG